jgi:hypothetical protein
MSKLTIITKWDKIEKNFPQNAGSNSGREWVITKFRIVVRRSRDNSCCIDTADAGG